MNFREDTGVLTCRCVMENRKPVLFVSHAGGDWQMYCHDQNHDFNDPAAMKRELVVVHAGHLLSHDPTLNGIADLPADTGAERSAVGADWVRFANADDD
jgi:hypothetical protein